MSQVELLRKYDRKSSVVVDTTLANCEEIDFREFAGGSFEVPSASSITTVTFYGTTSFGTAATHLPLYDTSNAAVTMVVAAGRIYPLPSSCYGLAAIKLVGNAAGSVHLFKKG